MKLFGNTVFLLFLHQNRLTVVKIDLIMVTSCERHTIPPQQPALHPQKKRGTPTSADTELPSDVPEGPEPKWYGIAILEGVRGPGAHCMKK